jgi:hypothetical protein
MEMSLLAHFTPEDLPITAAIFVAGIVVGLALAWCLIRTSAWRRPSASRRRGA